MSIEHDIWQPQEPGKAWKGAGLYHITLTIPSREPLLGTLVIPDDDPAQARVLYSDLGRAVLEYQKINAAHYPEIQILHYCLMPDHLHSIWYVRKAMPRGIEAAVRGFWQGVKKAGRAYSYLSSLNPESDSGEGKKMFEIAENLRGQIADADGTSRSTAHHYPLYRHEPAATRYKKTQAGILPRARGNRNR